MAQNAKEQTAIDLLLLCARSRLTPDQIARIRELARLLPDWDYLPEIAARHEVCPLLYRSLQASCPDQVPPGVMNILRDHYQDVVRHNFVMVGLLVRLMDQFAANGIRAVPFKGPLLASIAYGDLSLRQFSDLDLLVHHADLDRAADLLLGQGYRRVETKAAGHFEDQKHDIGLVHPESGIHVELHHKIAQEYYSLNFTPDWTSLTTAILGGRPVPSLSLEDCLLTVCLHGTKHGWEYLKWICDTGELAARPDMDWDQLLETAREINSERALFLGLYLAHQLLGVDLPPRVASEIAPQRLFQSLMKRVGDQLFQNTTGSTGVTRLLLSRLIFQLQIQQGLLNKLRYLRYFITYWLLIPDTPDQTVKVPQRFSILYSIVRPFRLFIRYGLGSLKQLGKQRFLSKQKK
jgi:hypothetical protein